MIELTVLTPFQKLLQKSVQKITFESLDGFHTVLPKHTDYVTALKTGIVRYVLSDGTTEYLACDEGILVKKGSAVSLSTRLGILSNDLKKLENLIATDFKKMEETRKENNKAMAQLELTLARGLLKLNKGENG